jgi:hypothetical protein
MTDDILARIERAAKKVHEIIQQLPSTPSETVIGAAIMGSFMDLVATPEGAGADDDPNDPNFVSLLGPDGKPPEFRFTNRQFGDLCPFIRMAYMFVGSDRARVEEMVRGLVEDDDSKDVFTMLEAWEHIEHEFAAVSGIAAEAQRRVMIVAETLVEEDTAVGRALNSGADAYLDGLEERRRAREAACRAQAAVRLRACDQPGAFCAGPAGSVAVKPPPRA